MSSASIPVTYNAGPPLTVWIAAMFAQGWNTLKTSCFPKAMDVLRLWDDGTRLGLIAPAQGSFDWTTLDARVAAAQAAGKQLIYVFGSTPAWAALSATGPAGAYDATSNRPPNLTLILPVVQAIAMRYKGKIAYYESWNEYNALGFYCGTKAQLLAWQQMINATIKDADPAALVTMPTPCWSTTTADEEIESLLAMGFQGYANIATFHGYFTPGAAGSAIGPTIAKIRAAMAAADCGFPLWDTEFGFSGSADGAALFTPAEQRQWVLDAFMTRLSYDVTLMGWYQWDNLTHSPGITDLTGLDLSPAGQAMVDLYAAFEAAI
jgi:hypothetical protein